MPYAVTNSEIEIFAGRFVKGYLRAHSHLWHLEDDLRQEARIGVWVAAQRFDPNRGATFYTYAHNWMRQKCSRFIRARVSVVNVPVNAPTRHDSELTPAREPHASCREIEKACARVDASRLEAKLIKITKSRSDAVCNQVSATMESLMGFPNSEIGKRAGVTRQAVSLIAIRNTKKLRKALAKEIAA